MRPEVKTETRTRQFKEQWEVHPGLALRTLVYHLIMLKRDITTEDVARHMGLSTEAVALQLRRGIRGTEGRTRLDRSMDDLDRLEPGGTRTPWLDRLDQALTELSVRKGIRAPSVEGAVEFSRAMEAERQGRTGDRGEPLGHWPKRGLVH